jgi:hypothetical protein
MRVWMLVWTTRGGRGPAFLLLLPLPMPSPAEFEAPLPGKELVEEAAFLVPVLVLV